MKKIILIIFIAVIQINTIGYAEFNSDLEDKTSPSCFGETVEDIDNIEVDNENSILEHKIQEIMGFNNICTPYLVIVIYLIIEIILVKKYKNLKHCMSVSLILVLLIFVLNNVIEKSAWEMHFCNIVINSLILIIGLMYQKRILKKYSEEDIAKMNSKMKILIVILAIISVIIYKIPKVRVVEREWGFSRTINTRTYDIVISEGKSIEKPNFKVIGIYKDGVIIEYNSHYYQRVEEEHWERKTEIVQQKLLWNTAYSHVGSRKPDIVDLQVEGGTDYYIRFGK